MASIRIKGVRDPITVSVERATKIKEALLDKRIPSDYVFAFSDIPHCFVKGEIRSIIFEPEEKKKKFIAPPKPTLAQTNANLKALKEARKHLVKKEILKSK